MKPHVIAALITFGLVGCESSSTTVATRSPPAATAATKTIQIISDPPGARIEVNDDYVGDAPISITVPTEGANFTKGTTIRATRTMQAEYVQAKYFDRTLEVPSRIFFSMGLGPAQ